MVTMLSRRSDAQRRGGPVVEEHIEFIPNDDFDSITEAELDRLDVELYADEDDPKLTGHPTAESFLIAVAQSRLLTPEGEQFLFKRLNFLRFRASALQATARGGRKSRKTVAEIERLLEESGNVREQIACANLRLVTSIVRRLSSSNDEFDEFLAEANTILLRAIDKFDYGRGYRFSTYATHAVQRHVFRLIERNQKRRQREVQTEFPEPVATGNTASNADAGTMKAVNTIMADFDKVLDDREQFIVRARFGLDGTEKGKSLRVIGDELGLSKERVRQLFNRSVEKLGEAVGPLPDIEGWNE